MKPRPPIIFWFLLLGMPLGLCWVAAAPSAQPRPEEAKPKNADQTVAFEMRQVPWPKVFEWLSDQTGLPVITNNLVVTDTFNFISPRVGKEPRKYTVPEVIDLINEGLLRQKFTLIRRANSFLLVPADEKIDPVLLPRIEVKDLEQRGNTEIVIVELGLEKLVAEDFAPEVKKSLGPFGEVSYLSKANRLILQDSAGNLRRVLKSIKEIEESEKSLAETFSHKCVYIRASAAAATLKELLGDAKQLVEMTKPTSPGPEQRFGPPQPPRPTTFTKIRMHYISADERTNTVHVTGPPDKIAQAKAVIKSLDVAQNGQRPIAVGPPILQTYAVPAGNAEAVVKTLQGIFKEASNLRISALGNTQIMVYAGPEDQMEIARHIQGVRPPAGATELLPLNLLEAARAVEILKGMFGDVKSGAPFIEAQAGQNAIVVRGSVEQVTEVKSVLRAIDGDPAAQAGTMRVIILDKGSAATMAGALQYLLPQMRGNPVKVILPGNLEAKPEEPKKPLEKPAVKPEPPQEEAKINAPPVSFVAAVGQPQLTDPSADKKSPAPPAGKPGAPIFITAFGNKLIVTSEDPQALALVQEMVRLLTQTQAGEGDFEVIRLKNANAVDVAKVLDEAFNGPRSSTGPGRPAATPGGPPGSPGFSPFGGMSSMIQGMLGGAMGGSARVERIRVVADTTTNALLVKATPLDMLTIRNLLARALDTGETDSRAVIKTWMIGPLKHANVTDVAAVIRDVFRESINNNPVGGSGGGGFPFFGGGGMRPATQNVDAQGNPRGVMLSVGTDERTNTLVLACPQLLYEDIKKLVDQMEKAAADTTQIVKVVSIKGVDPALVQQALDAIQGRKTSTGSSILGSGRFGSTGFSPFGGGIMGGGFSPFRGSFGPPGGSSGTSPFSPGPGSNSRSFRRGSSRGPGGGPQSRGPDFFVDRVKDDPRPILFDPRLDKSGPVASGQENLTTITLASAQLPPDPSPPPAMPGNSDATAPRLPVTAEALSQLGIVVLRANNAADLEAALRIVEFIQKQGAGAEVDIQIVPLKHADATSVTNILLQLYQRVQVGPNATTIAAPTTTGGQPQIQAQAQPQGADQGQIAQMAQAATVVMIPLPRHNSILLAALRARTADILREIQRLDIPVAPEAKATAFPLKRAAAARVASLIISFYADRFPNETRAQHQIRVTYDDSSNTVFVQAAPADLAEIRALIERIDSTVSSAVNDLRILRLNNALAEELANVIMRSIAEGVLTPSTGLGQQAGQLGGLGQTGAGPGGLGGLLSGGQGPLGGLTGQAGQAGGLGTTRQTKSTSLRFFAKRKDGLNLVEAGILDDIRITPDARTNSLVLSAPEKTMQLIIALVKELDVPPTARAEINIFTLKKADAGQVAAMLQQLFLGTGGTTGGRTGTTGATGPGGLPGLPGLPGQTTQATQAGATGTGRPLQLSLGGTTPEGAPLIDLRVTIDERTNSLIVAGSRNDLQIIEVIVSRLEDSNIQQRQHEAVRLKNSQAVDVANALNDFLTKSLNVLQKGNQLTAFQEIQRDVIIAAEPISNTLLVSATPAYFPDIMRLINQLDALPPQVVIQVLVADVALNNSEELGFEVGLQSPVLFQRTIIPATGMMGSGSANYAVPTTGNGLVPPGVTVNSTINPSAYPGFNFNNVLLPLGNNPAVSPGLVGFQGLGNLGTGRMSPTNNVGGFVFSAASDSFNLLIRALKVQGRIDILSRPQVMTLDSQTAYITVGQNVPLLGSSTLSSTGLSQQNIDRKDVGILLTVTPKISPDGRIVMRVNPIISALNPQPVPLGNGQSSFSINQQELQTTVSAYDGETVALGGLITKQDSVTDNKIPCLGDLPVVGCLFRYRTQTHTKKELLVILTPHIVYSSTDAERILAEEQKRIDWILADVNKIHGPVSTGPRILPEPVGPNPVLPWPDGLPEQGPLPRPLKLPEPTSSLKPSNQAVVMPVIPVGGLQASDRKTVPVSVVADQVPAAPPAQGAEHLHPQAINQKRENRPWRLVP